MCTVDCGVHYIGRGREMKGPGYVKKNFVFSLKDNIYFTH